MTHPPNAQVQSPAPSDGDCGPSAVPFLLADEASFVAGDELCVDAGMAEV